MKTITNRRIEKKTIEKKYKYYEKEKTPLYYIIILVGVALFLTVIAIFLYKKNVEIFVSIMLGILAIGIFLLAVILSFYNIKAKIWTRRYKQMRLEEKNIL